MSTHTYQRTNTRTVAKNQNSTKFKKHFTVQIKRQIIPDISTNKAREQVTVSDKNLISLKKNKQFSMNVMEAGYSRVI